MRMQLAGGAYKGRSTNASSQEMINLFQEQGQSSRDEKVLVGIHGGTVFSTLTGEVRGLYKLGTFTYAVAAQTLYRVDSGGNATALATIGSASGPVSMADNGLGMGNQLIIADGGRLKVWDVGTETLTTTTSPKTNRVGFIDGYIVGIETNTGRFFYSGLYNATNLPALNFQTAEGSPDNLVSLFIDRREVWLLGEDTLEIFYNAGDVDNAFARFQGGFGQMGCAATHSVARFDNAVAWLGVSREGDPVPVISRNYAPEYLTSQHPQVAYQIAQYETVSDAIGYAYRWEGHEFYVLTFPTENVTWAYDAVEKEWHQRAHIINDTFPNRERFSCHAYSWNKHLVGDYSNGKIYKLSSKVYTLDGTKIPNIRTTVGMKDKDEDRVPVRSVQLTGEEGVSGNVSLSYSGDGGHTFSNPRTISFGETGQYKWRAVWRKFKSRRDWIFRIYRSEDAKTVYTGLLAKTIGE